MDKAELVRRLGTVLPPACLLHAAEDLRPFECDGLTAYHQLPLAVALPEDEAQVSAVLRLCHEAAYRWSRAAPAPGSRAAPCRTHRASRSACRR